MKKIMMLMIATVMVFSMAGQAAAYFSAGNLIRVVYDAQGTIEVATELGPIADKNAPFTNKVVYNQNNFSTSQFGGAPFSNLYVAYFAHDWNDIEAYLSGPMTSQTSGARKFQMLNTSITNMINGYNGILSENQKMGSMLKKGVQSYYTQLDLGGNNKGSFNAFIPAANGEANLGALATVGYVDQTLYYYDFSTVNHTAQAGVKMAVIRTFADGHTELNPNAVPVPASVLLLGSGLLGLIGIRRKMAA